MTDTTTQTTLESLKSKATTLGIQFHPNIGVDSLRERINAKMDGDDEPASFKNDSVEIKEETKMQRHARLRREASKLVRINVTCMNPNMREHTGAIYTVSNSVVGTHRKYVPFDTEDGFHVPNIIYQSMKERKCQVFHSVPDGRGGKKRVGKLIRELNIEVLPPLTKKEIEELRIKQAMANNLTD